MTTFIFPLPFEALIGAFQPKTGRDAIFSVIDPFRVWFPILGTVTMGTYDDFSSKDPLLRNMFKNMVFNNALRVEQTVASDKSHDLLRKSAASHPLLKEYCGNNGSANTDVVTDNLPSQVKQNVKNRYRGFDGVPLAFITYILGFILANDLEIRNYYIMAASADMMVPGVWNEFMKSHRDGIIHNRTFTVQLSDNIRPFLTLINLNGTIFDPDWLRNTSNLALLLNMYTEFSTHPGCYIAFEKAVLLPISAGQTVSASGISTLTTDADPQFLVSEFPGSNIPKEALNIYRTDAILSGRVLSFIPRQTASPISNTAQPFVLNMMPSDSYYMYCIARACGSYKNKPPASPPPAASNPLDSEGTQSGGKRSKKPPYTKSDANTDSSKSEIVETMLKVLLNSIDISDFVKIIKKLKYFKPKPQNRFSYAQSI